MRAIRKVTAYVCTHCITVFPSAREARAHVTQKHPAQKLVPGRPRTRRGPTSADRILTAIKQGAKSAEQIERKTKIPLKRVHSFLTYLRQQGRISGFSGELRARRIS